MSGVAERILDSLKYVALERDASEPIAFAIGDHLVLVLVESSGATFADNLLACETDSAKRDIRNS